METISNILSKRKISLVIILISTMAMAQENVTSNGLEYNYFSITPIEVYENKNYGGIAISSSIGFSIKDHLFSFNVSTGAEFVILGWGSTFYQINLLYGREFKLGKIIRLDTHAGAGIYGFNDHDDTKLTSFGLPLIAKLRFKTGESFSLGLKFQANINSIENIQAFGVLLQWNSIK